MIDRHERRWRCSTSRTLPTARQGPRVPGVNNLDAARLRLTVADLAEIGRAVPPSAVAGDRYAAPLMAMLDSER